MIKYIGKQLRIEKGYTVRGLAAKAEIAPSTITKWENGSALPDLDKLDLVATALGVAPWHLVKYYVKKKPEACVNAS